MDIDLAEWEAKHGVSLEQKVISIRRVAKVVAGGRRFRFTSLVAVGTGNGQVGVGSGKAQEVPIAVQKAAEQARKCGQSVPIVDETIPFDVIGKYNSTRVVIRRAAKGTGVIAGGAARAILELAGVKNVLTKIIGSRNPYNVARATLNALAKIYEIESRKEMRGKKEPSKKIDQPPARLKAALEEEVAEKDKDESAENEAKNTREKSS